ncbi:MAG: hypothetical protein GY765_20820 [bacterium]|nr:hypothetical protein [bacterium]
MNFIKYGSLLLALQLLLLPAVLLVLTALLFWVGVSITVIHFPFSLAITIAGSLLLVRKNRHLRFIADDGHHAIAYDPDDEISSSTDAFATIVESHHSRHPGYLHNMDFIKITVIFLCLVILATGLSMWVYDFSQDGQAYHQPGILALADGWNPFHQTTLQQFNPEYVRALGGKIIFVDHYAKGSWFTAASLLKLTGSIESGKMFNWLYMAAAFFITLHFLTYLRKVHNKSKILLAVLTALNPVVLYQLCSFYNDAQLASLTSILIILVFQYIMFKDRKALIFIMLTVVVLGNIKFTGLAYALAVTGIAWVTVIVLDKDIQKRFLLLMTIAFFVSIVVVGFQPYMVNTWTKGNPFFPAVRTGEQGGGNVILHQAPPEFIKQNRFVKLFYSLFAKTDNRMGQMPQLKVPFTMEGGEIEVFRNVDARYGGFGPYFGGVLLLLQGALLFLYRSKRLVVVLTLITTVVIVVTACLNPEAWWARLAPQLWLLPITFIAVLYYVPPLRGYVAYIRGFAIAVLILNSFLVFSRYVSHTMDLNVSFKRQMVELRETSVKSELEVYPGDFQLALGHRLESFGVKHRMVETVIRNRNRVLGTPGSRYRRR